MEAKVEAASNSAGERADPGIGIGGERFKRVTQRLLGKDAAGTANLFAGVTEDGRGGDSMGKGKGLNLKV